MSVFFFQAEDGIRDHCVTGVQTCALPICESARRSSAWRETGNRSRRRSAACGPAVAASPPSSPALRGRWHRHRDRRDRKSTRLNSSHTVISYAVFCLKKKKIKGPGEHDLV